MLFCAGIFLLASCKKKDEPEEETPAPVVVPKQVSVKINNSLYTCETCANTYFSGGMHGINASETGGSNRFVINFDTLPSVRNYVLSNTGPSIFTYEKNGRYYKGFGSLNVTAVQAGSTGSIKVFKATFNCMTDTASDGSHFTFSEGEYNLNFK